MRRRIYSILRRLFLISSYRAGMFTVTSIAPCLNLRLLHNFFQKLRRVCGRAGVGLRSGRLLPRRQWGATCYTSLCFLCDTPQAHLPPTWASTHEHVPLMVLGSTSREVGNANEHHSLLFVASLCCFFSNPAPDFTLHLLPAVFIIIFLLCIQRRILAFVPFMVYQCFLVSTCLCRLIHFVYPTSNI